MSISGIEFIKAETVEIKEESNLPPAADDDAQNAGYDTLDVRANNTKCGEVFLMDTDKFLLICSFCDELYASMHDFGEHIREKHLNVTVHDEDVLEVKGEDIAPASEPAVEPVEVSVPDVSELEPEISMQDGEGEAIEEMRDDSEGDDEYNPTESDASKDSDPEASGSDYEPKRRSRTRQNREPDPSLFCDKCNRQYKSSITFNRHCKTVHDQNREDKKPENFKCRYCDKEFATEEELSEHKNTHDRFRPFQCPQCPKSFTSSNHRQKHINMHMGYRPYKCTKCPSAFGTECNLRQHMLTHAVAGPLSCEICGKQFIHQSRKDVHMRSHTGEKPFQCEQCGRKFIIRSRLTEHMKRHNNTRNHGCEICGKKFYTNVMLKHHQVAHSNDRPFACTDCGKTFPRKISLKMHRKIHSDVKQYSCNICGKEFRQYAGLYAHRKSHGEKKGLPQTNIAVSDKYTPPTHLLIVHNEDSREGES
ncbi:unnamed protein product [Hermetia illucens]|uniref:C2H2-type domain-containing protein n=1 Tax=Hermetia illucens TaxID=343691 RepID=A0A7R8YWN8_HERIL|nr:zinc finger protein OZF-like isoform X2 [Hermetia illucens]CAD7087001.1 unnamed protein product [Hermetia illucens]